jgi:hypothetical protein
MFGGNNGSTDLNDVWELMLTVPRIGNRSRSARRSPGWRSGHTAIYDEARDRVIVFGGYNNNVRRKRRLGAVPFPDSNLD